MFGFGANTTLGFDTVCLWGAASGADLCLDNQLFSMIDGLSFGTFNVTFDRLGLDGVFGMGRQSATDLLNNSFLTRAVK